MPQEALGLDPEDPTVQTAVLGKQVQDWLEGPVGSFVMGRCQDRLEYLEQALKTVNPEKPMEVAKLQAEIKHWEGFAGWLGSAIQAGHTAVQIIDGEVDG